MDLAEYRRTSQDIWERMAAGWSGRREWVWQASRTVGEWMVAKVDPQPGQTILELAAGTGETGFVAAARLGDDGRLISTDFASRMVEAGRERAAELGLSNVEFRQMDAEHMDLDDDAVDGVLCRWGYMLMADPAAALAETRRVLRDGGRLALSVWSAADDNPWGTISREVLNAHGYLPAPKPGDPGIFSMGREERIRELVGGAGFEAIEIEAIPLEWRFDAFDDYWYFLQQMAGAIALVLERLEEEQRTEVHDEMERKAAPFRANGAYVMPGKVLNAVAS